MQLPSSLTDLGYINLASGGYACVARAGHFALAILFMFLLRPRSALVDLRGSFRGTPVILHTVPDA